MVRAGLAAFPYLGRLGAWHEASTMLEQVDQVDQSPAIIAAILPRMRRVVNATTGTEDAVSDRAVLGKLLRRAGHRREAEQELRAAMRQAADLGQFRVASAARTQLVRLLQDASRYDEALEILAVVSRRHFFFVAPDWRHVTGTMMAALGGLRGFVGERR